MGPKEVLRLSRLCTGSTQALLLHQSLSLILTPYILLTLFRQDFCLASVNKLPLSVISQTAAVVQANRFG